MLTTDSNTLPGLDPTDALATLTPADAPRFRITVQQDADGFDGPLQWGGLTCISVGAVVRGYGSNSDATPTEGADPLDLARVLDRISEGIPARPGHWADIDRSAEAVIRWARIFHGRTVARWAVSLNQSTWVDGLVYLDDPEDGAIEPDTSTLTQWARGEVFTVSLERNTADDLSDPEAADWEPIDTIGGTYFDEGHERDATLYGPAQAAHEQFGVPLDFAQAVDVVELDPTW